MDSRDLFISHASEDDAIARELRAALEAMGYTCWMAPDDVVGSRPWAEQILTAIISTRIMVVLISRHANDSVHVSREVNLALGHARAILPIRIEEVAPGGALEYLLTLVQRADAFPPPVDGHLPRIRRMVDALLEAAPGASAGTVAPPPTDALPPDPADPLDAVTRDAAAGFAEPMREPGPPPAPGPGPTRSPASPPSRVAEWARANVAIAAGSVGLGVVAILAAAVILGLGPKPSSGPSASTAVNGASPTPSAAPTASTVPTTTPVPPPPDAPTGLTARAIGPTEVDLSWTPAPPGVTGYEVYRNRVLVRTLAAGTAAYRDLGTAPGTTFAYTLVAVGPGGHSPVAAADATTATMPPATAGRFAGAWTVSRTATSVSAPDVKVGDTHTEDWSINPSCAAGGCDVTAAGVLGLTELTSLTRTDAGYEGTVTVQRSFQACGTTQLAIAVSLRPIAAGYTIAGDQLVGQLTGTAVVTATSSGCPGTSTVTWSLSGTLHRPDPASLLDPTLQCSTLPLAADRTAWKTAVAAVTCSAGDPAKPVRFYQYLFASDAQADFRAFTASVVGPETACAATPPAAGNGPWGHPGASENAGEVACGYVATDDKSAARIFVWSDWEHAIVGYGQWADGTALRDFWLSPAAWLAP